MTDKDTTKTESHRAKAAFTEYCALGPSRSLAKLSKVTVGDGTVHIRQLERWSSDFKWVLRAGQYDAERAEERKAKLDAEIDAMNARHALIATSSQSKALKQIESLIASNKFGSQASVALLKLALECEREARGASVSKLEITGKDGGAIAVNGSIAIYLPAKDPEV
jgi:hypothetical protein